MSQTNSQIPHGMHMRERIYSTSYFSLYRYSHCKNQQRVSPPLLIVYALINKPYILDFDQNRSLISKLLQYPLSLYLIEWHDAEPTEKRQGFAYYVVKQLAVAVNRIILDSGYQQVNLLGVCQGGVMSLCYCGLYPEKVKNLITMVTPVNFQTDCDLIYRKVRQLHWLENWQQEVLAGKMMVEFFKNLKPLTLRMKKYMDFIYRNPGEQEVAHFQKMEQWIEDCPDVSATFMCDFIKIFYKKNSFMQGNLQLEKQKVQLSTLQLPILNIFAKQDHIVPIESSQALRFLVSSRDYEEFAYSGGHIGIYVGKSAQEIIAPKMAQWLLHRQ